MGMQVWVPKWSVSLGGKDFMLMILSVSLGGKVFMLTILSD